MLVQKRDGMQAAELPQLGRSVNEQQLAEGSRLQSHTGPPLVCYLSRRGSWCASIVLIVLSLSSLPWEHFTLTLLRHRQEIASLF